MLYAFKSLSRNIIMYFPGIFLQFRAQLSNYVTFNFKMLHIKYNWKEIQLWNWTSVSKLFEIPPISETTPSGTYENITTL